MKDLIYKEDGNLRTFASGEFAYIFDKETMTSFSWGKDRNDDPKFNPIGPEIVTFIVGDSYVFDSERIRKLLSMNTGDGTFATVCRAAVIVPEKDLTEANKLATWLLDRHVFSSICLDYEEYADLKNIVKLKLAKIKNILLLIKNGIDGLSLNVKNFIDNGMYVSLKFDYPKDIDACLEEIRKLPEGMPIEFVLDDERSIQKVSSFKAEHPLRQVNVKNEKFSDIGKFSNVIEYDASLFSCVIDFNDMIVYPKDSKIALDLGAIEFMAGYWNSKEFERHRKALLKKLDNKNQSKAD